MESLQVYRPKTLFLYVVGKICLYLSKFVFICLYLSGFVFILCFCLYLFLNGFILIKYILF